MKLSDEWRREKLGCGNNTRLERRVVFAAGVSPLSRVRANPRVNVLPRDAGPRRKAEAARAKCGVALTTLRLVGAIRRGARVMHADEARVANGAGARTSARTAIAAAGARVIDRGSRERRAISPRGGLAGSLRTSRLGRAVDVAPGARWLRCRAADARSHLQPVHPMTANSMAGSRLTSTVEDRLANGAGELGITANPAGSSRFKRGAEARLPDAAGERTINRVAREPEALSRGAESAATLRRGDVRVQRASLRAPEWRHPREADRPFRGKCEHFVTADRPACCWYARLWQPRLLELRAASLDEAFLSGGLRAKRRLQRCQNRGWSVPTQFALGALAARVLRADEAREAVGLGWNCRARLARARVLQFLRREIAASDAFRASSARAWRPLRLPSSGSELLSFRREGSRPCSDAQAPKIQALRSSTRRDSHPATFWFPWPLASVLTGFIAYSARAPMKIVKGDAASARMLDRRPRQEKKNNFCALYRAGIIQSHYVTGYIAEAVQLSAPYVGARGAAVGA